MHGPIGGLGRGTLALLVGAWMVASGGCSSSVTTAPPGLGTPFPPPSSPAATMRSFQWSWENRSLTQYRGLFDATLGESCDSTAVAWNRNDELQSFDHMIEGGGALAVPDRIRLDFSAVTAAPDTRPGRDPRWHQIASSPFQLALSGAGMSPVRLVGTALFEVVRGDSASIPGELTAQGVTPDSTRWYIARMAFVRDPSQLDSTTWCGLRQRYR